jgi:hypothetical protein
MMSFSPPRRLTLLTVLVLVVPLLGAVLLPTPARGQGGVVVITQVYAGGQSGSAPIRSDYVALFNRGTDLVVVDHGPPSADSDLAFQPLHPY